MSTVGKSQNAAWQNLLDTQGLSAAAPILEEYGLSCESHISLVDEQDLVVLCSQLKPFQSKLLRKWVQGLGAEQRDAAFMKDASTAKKHSTSHSSEHKGEEDEVEEENGDEDEDADADADADSDEEDEEAHGGAAAKQGPGDGKVMKTCASSASRACNIIRRMESEPRKALTMLLLRKKPKPQLFQQSCSRLSLSSTLLLPNILLFCVCMCVMRHIFICIPSPSVCAVCVCAVDMRIESILVECLRNFDLFGRGLNRLFDRFLQ